MASQQRSEETYNHLLDMAGRCFAKEGYDATSVAKICRQAGVSKGAFYYHFSSKQALFLELLNRWLTQLDQHMADLRSEAASAPEALLHMATAIRQVLASASGRFPIFLEFWVKAQRDPVVWEATIEPYRRYQHLIVEIIETGIAEGTLRSVDAEMVAQTLVSLAVGHILQGTLTPQDAEWGEVAEQSIRLFMEGLLVSEGGAPD
ncbi:MAG: TetR/AcrR family transcriptional regulator [Anaerolineae bacterium]